MEKTKSISTDKGLQSRMRVLMSQSEPLSRSKSIAAKMSKCFLGGLRVGSVLRTWAELSRLNFFTSQADGLMSVPSSIRRRSNDFPPEKEDKAETQLRLSDLREITDVYSLQSEQFPVNVTSLLNEDQYWGCFYTFPELYEDVYSPVVMIREIQDVPELVSGVLTRDLIAACLTFLKRTPILGDFVLIKLDLSYQQLINIEVLRHYKYVMYLDLSSNYLTELTVLSFLQYLQFLNVSFNSLKTVLEYEVPQWFLTEVHYKFNSVTRIGDLKDLWSITILDLSHNNIKCISGLENLRYLRRLDLSFNHIQRLENLNHLRLLWLDVSYNNISTFEFGIGEGLWTLLHLEYLNLNENNLTSMKIFCGCTRIRELHVRNNRLSMLLELAVYMRKMQRLTILDLRSNPICSTPGYKDVVINTFPLLISLDNEELDPVDQRKIQMDMAPDLMTFATRRLLRLLYIEQLSRAHVSPYIPPADTTEVPLVVLVGYEAVGKGTLARRLAAECRSNVDLALQHTTAPYNFPGHYNEVTREKFDDMLLGGEFLTYSEMDGESYGLSREEAFINGGKVKILSMDLTAALMLKLRGRRPYIILASCLDKQALSDRQESRKMARAKVYGLRSSREAYGPFEKSTLQVVVSGRILITGILNEILMSFPDEPGQSEFVITSECSLLMDSDVRQVMQEYARGVNLLTLLASSTTSLDETESDRSHENARNDLSLCSLYKESQITNENASGVNDGQNFSVSQNIDYKKEQRREKLSTASQDKGVDFTRYASSTWKGMSGANSSKSSKSVTFTAQDAELVNKDDDAMDTTEMFIDPPFPTELESDKKLRSWSTKFAKRRGQRRSGSVGSLDDDLWLAFLYDTGLLKFSESFVNESDTTAPRHNTREDDPDYIMKQLEYYHKIPTHTYTTNITDDYEDIHRKCPGLFWDTVTMDDPDEAFDKMKRIVKDIVKSQSKLKPMFDIEFTKMFQYYPTVEKKMTTLCDQSEIWSCDQRLFF